MKKQAVKNIILVMGMHRSGTSAITRALQVFGIQLGEKLMPALPDNAKGFWEDLEINALNIEMMNAINSDWHNLAPIGVEDVSKLINSKFFLQAVSLLCQKTEDASVFGFKDPRVSKLLPFWKAVFAHCEFSVQYIITLRNPLSVCKSLQIRDGFDHRKSYALWQAHLIYALLETVGEKSYSCRF